MSVQAVQICMIFNQKGAMEQEKAMPDVSLGEELLASNPEIDHIAGSTSCSTPVLNSMTMGTSDSVMGGKLSLFRTGTIVVKIEEGFLGEQTQDRTPFAKTKICRNSLVSFSGICARKPSKVCIKLQRKRRRCLPENSNGSWKSRWKLRNLCL